MLAKEIAERAVQRFVGDVLSACAELALKGDEQAFRFESGNKVVVVVTLDKFATVLNETRKAMGVPEVELIG